MANFFNSLGSSVVTGSTLQDQFFPFTASTNLDNVFPDVFVSSFTWTTAIRTVTGNYQFSGVNIQVSTDLLLGGDKSDVLYGSNLNDAILYNNGAIGGGVGIAGPTPSTAVPATTLSMAMIWDTMALPATTSCAVNSEAAFRIPRYYLVQFQEKWAPVFRPELQQNKKLDQFGNSMNC